MATPSYSDLGKAARDVFNSGYVFDVLKLDLKTNQNVEIKAGGTQHLMSNAVNANLETKYVLNKSKYCESRLNITRVGGFTSRVCFTFQY